MVKFAKQVLKFVAGSPVISVSLFALILFGYVVYAALTTINSSNFIAFSRLCVVIVLSTLVIVMTVLSYWRGQK